MAAVPPWPPHPPTPVFSNTTPFGGAIIGWLGLVLPLEDEAKVLGCIQLSASSADL